MALLAADFGMAAAQVQSGLISVPFPFSRIRMPSDAHSMGTQAILPARSNHLTVP